MEASIRPVNEFIYKYSGFFFNFPNLLFLRLEENRSQTVENPSDHFEIWTCEINFTGDSTFQKVCDRI